jgi:hypothetical protein
LVAFAAYPLHFRGQFIPQPSLSAALERFFVTAESGARPADPYAAARAQVLAQVTRAAGQVTRRLAALAGDEPAPGAAESLRTQASWLLALASQVTPEQTVLEVDTGDAVLNIALDTALTPVAQAQRMFKRAAKLERAAQIIPQRRAELLADQELLAQLALDAQRAANQPELAAVVEELRRAGFARTPARRDRPRRPARAARCAIAPRAAPRSSSGATPGRTSRSPSSWRATMTPGCTCAAHRAHTSSCARLHLRRMNATSSRPRSWRPIIPVCAASGG